MRASGSLLGEVRQAQAEAHFYRGELAEAARRASITVLDGQPIGLEPPPTEGAPRGVVGDEKVAFQSPLVTIYIQLDERAAADRLGAHAFFAQNLTTAAAGVLEAYSHLFEVAFVLNDDIDKPARP